jgi:1,4-dihydroxy-2-naphthoate octaprenyltransferase
VLRYRFLLIAGLMPYVLGSAAALYFGGGSFNSLTFLLGLIGAGCALIGVETYNEFFETRSGTDLVFEANPTRVPSWTFGLGSIAFSTAFLLGIYLATVAGTLILALLAYGFIAAIFYVGPPIKWAYRGFGEVIIALAYGPFMTLGGYYIQTSRLDGPVLLLSLVPGFLTFATVLSNEIPQGIGDGLVGKMNLVVRLGERRTAMLHQLALAFAYLTLVVIAILRIVPPLALTALVTLPLAVWTISTSAKSYEHPKEFIRAIRGTVGIYTLILIILSATFIYPPA